MPSVAMPATAAWPHQDARSGFEVVFSGRSSSGCGGRRPVPPGLATVLLLIAPLLITPGARLKGGQKL